MSSNPDEKAYRDKLRAAARHLRCDPTSEAIVEACQRLADDRCDSIDTSLTPAERLDVLADHASVLFEVAHSDEEMDQIAARYARRGELGFLTRRHRFDGDLLAAILRRQSPREGDRTFVALLDARRERASREFFSRAHETAHPILEPQLAFDFREETAVRDPWEELVDRAGAAMVFGGDQWRRVVAQAVPRSTGMTVAAIAKLKGTMAKTASLTVVALATANQAKRPVLVIWAGSEGSQRDPIPVLRVLQLSPNAVAMETSIVHIHRKRRIPNSSPIAQSYQAGGDAQGFEDLGLWVDSQGVALPGRRVWTAARATPKGVFAVIDFGPSGKW